MFRQVVLELGDPHRRHDAIWPYLASIVKSIAGNRRPTVPRPADLFDREVEWAELAAFATDGEGATTLGIASGRRRQGKSFLNPSHALFHEADLLLTEDPALSDRALYHSIVASVARGHATKTRVASDLGRKDPSLDHPIAQLERAGVIVRDHDLLRPNRPLLRVGDPIIRFSSSILRRDLARFERRDTAAAWADAEARFAILVLGPHFEAMARMWTTRHASVRTLGGVARQVGFVQVHDPVLRQAFELDVAVCGADLDGTERILAIGEAKGGTARRTLRDLQRLQRLRMALGARADVTRTKLLLFGCSGFQPDVVDAARSADDIELIDLRRLYEGD